jgi:hypothetical protein
MAFLPYKTNSVFLINADTVLVLPVTFQAFQSNLPLSIQHDLTSKDRHTHCVVQKFRFRSRIIGGDASESYFVNIEFDANAVRSRSFYSGMIPDEPTQITRYFQRTID